LNLLQERHAQEIKSHLGLKLRINRYNQLKDILEEINQGLTLESVADRLSAIVFSLLGQGKGVCILYLADAASGRLEIFKSKKEDAQLVIRAKEGDILDQWVLRHTQPLLIEDIKSDFRFEPQKLGLDDIRRVSSLISVPLLSGKTVLGVLRLESAQPRAFTQDDLRLMAAIGDMAAVALENAGLFQKMQDLATHDELTGLYTKGYFLERLREEYRRSLRGHWPLSLLMLDIDYFKRYNDKFGHTAGDLVLKVLAQEIREELKESSHLLCRFGGEEFCVLLCDATKASSLEIAEKLRKRIEKIRLTLRRSQAPITVSIGVSSFPGDAKDEEELLIHSDKMMYAAKQKGRNRVCGS
jgi:diguanylate cyclase (GGDEF)-like protein